MPEPDPARPRADDELRDPTQHTIRRLVKSFGIPLPQGIAIYRAHVVGRGWQETLFFDFYGVNLLEHLYEERVVRFVGIEGSIMAHYHWWEGVHPILNREDLGRLPP